MNCIIIDDEVTSRVILHQLCSEIKSLTVVAEFENAVDAIKYLNKNEVDLVLLDIHLPDFTGFEFIQTLKNPPKVIITSSDKNFAIEAYEYDCIIDYLEKPILLPRFKKAIHKAKTSSVSSVKKIALGDETSGLENELYINIDKRLIKIDITSIYVIEAKGDYVSVKTETNNFVIHTTLKKIQEKLPQTLFFKIHRSYIINLKKIDKIEDNCVIINKEVVPISRYVKADLWSKLNLL